MKNLCARHFRNLSLVILAVLIGLPILPANAVNVSTTKQLVGIQSPESPEGDVVNYSVPMIHQLWDTADSFNGSWACGPTSAVMALAYYNKLTPQAMNVSYPSAHTSSYGFYVSNVYSAYGYSFSRAQRDPSGRLAYGAYGHITNGGQAWAYLIKDYLSKHGIPNEFSDRTGTTYQQDFDYIKAQLNQGYLPIVGRSFRLNGVGYGHLVIVRGYTSDNKLIINDPYGNQLGGRFGRAMDGDNVRYSVFNTSEMGSINWIVVAKGVADTDDNRVVVTSQIFNGTISPNSDQDTYWYDGSANTGIKIAMNKTSGALDSYLYIYRPNGTILAQNDDSNGTQNSEINVALPDTGRYKIVTASYNASSSGGYTLKIDPVNLDTDDYRWLSYNSSLRGAISPNSDRDVYYFRGSRDTVVNIFMVRASGGLDSYLELYNSNGTKLAYNDDGAGNLNSWLSYRLPADGTYSIVARSYSSASSGAYDISLLPSRTNRIYGLGVEASSDAANSESQQTANPVTDGDLDTSWVSGESPSQRLYVDLPAPQTIDQLIVRWDQEYATGYGVYYQDNTGAWQPLYATDSGDGDVDTLRFAPVTAQRLLVEMWSRPELYNHYAIREVEAYYAAGEIVPLVLPDDLSKDPETGVTPLAPLPADPVGKDAQVFALGAGQESFPLADGDGNAHAPTIQMTDTYRAPTATLSLNAQMLLPGAVAIAQAVNAHDQDSSQVGNGITAYRWMLIPTEPGPSGSVETYVGDQAVIQIAYDDLQPLQGHFNLVLMVRDDEGSWSEQISTPLDLARLIFVPSTQRETTATW